MSFSPYRLIFLSCPFRRPALYVPALLLSIFFGVSFSLVVPVWTASGDPWRDYTYDFEGLELAHVLGEATSETAWAIEWIRIDTAFRFARYEPIRSSGEEGFVQNRRASCPAWVLGPDEIMRITRSVIPSVGSTAELSEVQHESFGWPMPSAARYLIYDLNDNVYEFGCRHMRIAGFRLTVPTDWSALGFLVNAAVIGCVVCVALILLLWLGIAWMMHYRAQSNRCILCGHQMIAAQLLCSECGRSQC